MVGIICDFCKTTITPKEHFIISGMLLLPLIRTILRLNQSIILILGRVTHRAIGVLVNGDILNL